MRWAAAVVLLVSGATTIAQVPERDRRTSNPLPSGTAVIRGRVIAAATGDPLRHAIVRLAGGSVPSAPILTDEEGRFQFSELPVGIFTVTVSKPGFAKTSSRAELVARATAAVVDIAMPRGGIITGLVLDDIGEPVNGAGVIASRIVVNDDGSVQRIAVATATTDDLGAFRFGSLPADTYSVSPQRMPNGVVMAAAPGTDLNRIPIRMPEGPRIVLRSGEEHSGVVIVAPPDRLPTPPPPPGGRAGPPGSPIAPSSPPDPRRVITVRGHVTRPGGPASRAILQLMSLIPAPPVIAQADENGRYELVLNNGVEGDYRVAVRKPGYLFAEYGAQGNRRGALLHLKPGDTFEDVDVGLKKLSTVSGRIFDDFGDPVEGALVRVAQLRYADGQRKLVDAPTTASRTDDLGRYRIINLRAGQYALAASVGQVVVAEAAADFPGYSTTYFPGTTFPTEIQLMSVDNAQELTDIDFRLVRQKTYKVAGHASDSEGDPVSGGIGVDVTDEPLSFGREDQSLEDVEVVLTDRVTRLSGRITETGDVAPTDLAVLAFSSRRDQWYLNTRYIRRTVPQPNGSFSFEGLPPGEYYLLAAYPPDDPGEWRDPEMLETLAREATRARVSEGQQVSVELRTR